MMDKKGYLKKALKKAKKGAVNATADAMSLPSRIVNGMKSRRAFRDADTVRMARGGRGAPVFDASGKPTDAFKYRVMAEEIKKRRSK